MKIFIINFSIIVDRQKLIQNLVKKVNQLLYNNWLSKFYVMEVKRF